MVQLKRKYKRVWALIGDTHVGSRHAIFPRGIKTREGNTLALSRGQELLLNYWDEFSRICNDFEVDTVIHFGDAVEGLNPLEKGRGLMISELEVQKKAFDKLMTPLVSGRKFLMLEGSDYHGSVDTSVNEQMCEKLGGKYLGHSSEMDIEGTNKRIQVSHGGDESSKVLSKILDSNNLFDIQMKVKEKLPNVSIVARAHSHKFAHIHLPNHHIILIPCWKCNEPEGKLGSKSFLKFVPDIGGVILLIDDSNRVSIFHFLFNPPKIGDHAIKV